MSSRKIVSFGIFIIIAQVILSGCESEPFARQDYPNQATVFGNVVAMGIGVGFREQKLEVLFEGVSYGPMPFDDMANKAIRKIIGSSKVTCNYDTAAQKKSRNSKSRYGRCYVNGNDLALEMVKAGWLEIGYKKEDELGSSLSEYQEAQEKAKADCAGLWQVASWCK